MTEADRIAEKHLVTLEPGISQNQTDEMQAQRLQLVIPSELHQTYRPIQQAWLISLADFIAIVRSKQANN
ncbi:MAG: restriction endonuclease [Sphingomonas bacterium]|nr:restriction endonuclease [Sphingomonas bacterium]